MLSEDDLAPADSAILTMLEEGRVTAPFVADETGYSLQYVRDRLGRLVEHGNARKVYEGLYELVEDPRGGGKQVEDESKRQERIPTGGIEQVMSGGPTGKGMDVEETAAVADRFIDDASGANEDERVRARRQLDELDLPGSGVEYEKRVDAVLTLFDELRTTPGVSFSKSDFADVLAEKDTGYGSFDSFWSNWVSSGPVDDNQGNILEALPCVDVRDGEFVYTE